MATERKSWTAQHFSQSNPKGPGQDNVPALLRRVADNLEARGQIEVQDLILHVDIGDDGEEEPSLTVYFHQKSDGDA